MALKKTTATVYGVEIVNAYHRVEAIHLLGKEAISYRVRSYKDDSGVPFSGVGVSGSV